MAKTADLENIYANQSQIGVAFFKWEWMLKINMKSIIEKRISSF